MKRIRFILMSLVFGIGLGTICRPTPALEDEVKLIGVEDGLDNEHLCADIIGDSVVVGAHRVGIAKIYVGGGNKWKEQVELTTEDLNADRPDAARFGWAVSLTGHHDLASANTAIVGAPQDLHGADPVVGLERRLKTKGMKGAAYIFVRSGDTWKQQAKLAAPDPEDEDAFGFAVSIDRNTAIVGVPMDDDAGNNSGSAYIFVRDGNAWKQQAKLVPQDLVGFDVFGGAVFVHGNTAVVGASGHSHNGLRFPGAAYVFVREGTTWVEQAKLTADDAASSDSFGKSVALFNDTIIVGAPVADIEGKKDAGAAYVFAREGDTWKQQVKLIRKAERKGDQFGSGVAVAGNLAIVGAAGVEEAGVGAGAAYGFARVDGVWEEKDKVQPDDEGPRMNFGAWVAISGDMVVVSAHNAPNPDAPATNRGHGTAAYVYNSEEDFGTPPFLAVEPFELRVTTLGQVKRTALLQNFPNPFNPETWLPYRLAADAPVTLRIYNVRGQLMRELNFGVQKAGGYLTRETAAYWDGRDHVGETVSSGIYFYTLHAAPFQATRSMLILK